MTTQIETAHEFEREIERLGRKYPAVFNAIDSLISQLEDGLRPGDRVPGVGAIVYKVRLPNPSTRRGKRGGFRVIYTSQTPDAVFLLTVYSKTERDDIGGAAIRQIISRIS